MRSSNFYWISNLIFLITTCAFASQAQTPNANYCQRNFGKEAVIKFDFGVINEAPNSAHKDGITDFHCQLPSKKGQCPKLMSLIKGSCLSVKKPLRVLCENDELSRVYSPEVAKLVCNER